MHKNTSGALLVLIIAAAGLAHDNPWAWGLAAITCALAFLAEEFADVGSVGAAVLHVCLAVLSWVAVGAAFLALIV
ncbi:hypothetical protein [Mesorhizobium sp. M0589]|uniref:hypothetical protein n=1 Tax=Mesorhizobium sp. M0589 TaxID=2956965 RepID=UPI00333BD3AB